MPYPVRPVLPNGLHTDHSLRRAQPKEDITTQPDDPKHPTQQRVSRRPLITTKRGRVLARVLLGTVVIVGLIVAVATPAFGASTTAPTLNSVIDNLRNWIVGFLAALATLFLTIGGVRYLTAGGDPGQVEKAKTALKSAAIGYALAILAPLLVSILASVVGG